MLAVHLNQVESLNKMLAPVPTLGRDFKSLPGDSVCGEPVVWTLMGGEFGPAAGGLFHGQSCSVLGGTGPPGVASVLENDHHGGWLNYRRALLARGALEHCPSGYCGPSDSESLSSLEPSFRSLLPS